MITLSLLKTVCPKTKTTVLSEYVDHLNTVCEYYDIFVNTKRTAGFLSQIAHESANFNTIKENLNYDLNGLRKTFPKYFQTDDIAKQYAKQPEKIANRVYASRMKNGDEASGDGWKFRGRGLIQLTGSDNYTRLAIALDMSVDEVVAYLDTVNGAVASAGWFWDNNKLNDYCDKSDFIGLTKRINGGTNGIAERQALYDAAMKALQG